MNCTICNKPVVLVPSARERARKTGESPAYYTSLFREHAQCVTDKRQRETQELMRRLNSVKEVQE